MSDAYTVPSPVRGRNLVHTEEGYLAETLLYMPYDSFEMLMAYLKDNESLFADWGITWIEHALYASGVLSSTDVMYKQVTGVQAQQGRNREEWPAQGIYPWSLNIRDGDTVSLSVVNPIGLAPSRMHDFLARVLLGWYLGEYRLDGSEAVSGYWYADSVGGLSISAHGITKRMIMDYNKVVCDGEYPDREGDKGLLITDALVGRAAWSVIDSSLDYLTHNSRCDVIGAMRGRKGYSDRECYNNVRAAVGSGLAKTGYGLFDREGRRWVQSVDLSLLLYPHRPIVAVYSDGFNSWLVDALKNVVANRLRQDSGENARVVLLSLFHPAGGYWDVAQQVLSDEQIRSMAMLGGRWGVAQQVLNGERVEPVSLPGLDVL